MKKRVLSILMVVMMMCSMLSVNVLAHDDPAECTVATSWSSDADYHWYACADTTCTQQHSKDAHADTATVDGKCDACEYVLHEHVWSVTDVDYNDEYHWNLCKTSTACYLTDEADMYGYAKHVWTEDTTNTDPSKTVYTCTCGASKSEHNHVWATTMSHDDTNHWYECTASGCTSPVATKDVTAHVWEADAANSTATKKAYKCVCGAVDSEHVCVWETNVTWNDTQHWYKCSDPSCSNVKDLGDHYDYNNSKVCDFSNCGAPVAAKTFTTLTITGLTEPAEGAAVDFTIDVAEYGYGTPKVTWNKITNLSKGTSIALGSANTFTAGNMYNVGIVIPTSWRDSFDAELEITLNGQKVPFYKSAAFEAAQKTYEGNNTVYMAKLANVNGYQCVVIGVMYAKLPGTHVCTFGSDWVETPAKHYHLCSGCGATKDDEKHYDNNKSGLCDVCGYDMKYFNPNATATNPGTHTHSYSSDYIESATQHWKQCLTCSTKKELGTHADANNTGKCDVCGFVMTSSCTSHTYSTDYKEDSVHHWKECTICGIKTAIETHADANKSGLCDVCGYTMINPNTGDNGVLYVWSALFAVCIVGVAMTIVYMRKKENE